MRKLSAVLFAASAVMALSGCVPYAGGPYGTYDGYYDGYYGPYSSGYWANDGYFYYSDQQHNYHRDDGRHFRHERFTGGARFHGEHHGGRDSGHDGGDHGQDHH